jgi:hypothetical protein
MAPPSLPEIASVAPRRRRLAPAAPARAACLLAPALAAAVGMVNDPKGFQGIPWGTPLAERQDLREVSAGDKIREYEPADGTAKLGEIPVATLRFSTIQGKFARVTIRYQGAQTHRRILAYLQGQFGPLDLTPGQLAGGEEQQLTWRGPDTEVTLLYQRGGERGLLFIESRILAPAFIESVGCQ